MVLATFFFSIHLLNFTRSLILKGFSLVNVKASSLKCALIAGDLNYKQSVEQQVCNAASGQLMFFFFFLSLSTSGQQNDFEIWQLVSWNLAICLQTTFYTTQCELNWSKFAVTFAICFDTNQWNYSGASQAEHLHKKLFSGYWKISQSCISCAARKWDPS